MSATSSMGSDSMDLADLVDTIRRLCARVRELEPPVRRWLRDPRASDLTHPAREQFAEQGFATVNGVLPALAWQDLVECLWPLLIRVCDEVSMEQREISPTTVSDGAHFRRVDPYCLRNPVSRAAMSLLLDRLGLTSFANDLAAAITPLVRDIAGPVSYQRFYFYLYLEDDYISVHKDHQVGDCIDVQFPVSLASPGGVRVLSRGFLRMRYDTSGDMNLLGPRVWHEVPPLLRMSPDSEPRRFNMGFRFLPD